MEAVDAMEVGVILLKSIASRSFPENTKVVPN